MSSLQQDQIGAMMLAEKRQELRDKLKDCKPTDRVMLQIQVDFLSGLITAVGRNITRAKEWVR